MINSTKCLDRSSDQSFSSSTATKCLRKKAGVGAARLKFNLANTINSMCLKFVVEYESAQRDTNSSVEGGDSSSCLAPIQSTVSPTNCKQSLDSGWTPRNLSKRLTARHQVSKENSSSLEMSTIHSRSIILMDDVTSDCRSSHSPGKYSASRDFFQSNMSTAYSIKSSHSYWWKYLVSSRLLPTFLCLSGASWLRSSS